jgi:hypothetical protein
MKLTSAAQPGLRRRRPDNRRDSVAFWAGIAILVAFELILMAKSWSPASAALIFGYDADRDRTELGGPPPPPAPDPINPATPV